LNILTTINLCKTYGKGDTQVEALKDVSFCVSKGEFVSVIGPSGSGKSTLLNMIGALDYPTSGKVTIDGRDIDAMKEEELSIFRRRNIGFIFQAYHLLPMFTAMENVSLPLIFQGMEKKKREKMAQATLAEVGLAGYGNRKPTQMSGGQQQRVGIARALVGNPKIIFADEPTGNLDTHTSKEVMEIMMAKVREFGRTLIIVTHDRKIADFADRIVTIQDGNILSIEENKISGG